MNQDIYKMGTVEIGNNPVPAAPKTETTTTTKEIPSPAVFSGVKAVDFLNKTIVPTMDSATKSLQDQQLKAQQEREAQAKAAEVAAKAKPIEKPVAETPAQPGTKYAYKADGSSVAIPLSANAADYGYYDVKPGPKPVTDTAELASGTKVKRFNDGTFGLFNVEDEFIGVGTEQQFNNARNTQDTLSKLNQAVNGNYPLTPAQQAQIDGVKQTYMRLLQKQEVANQNFTGGTTIAQNLYGMGNSLSGLGAIKGTVDEGIAKITDIQSKMNSDVANMTQAFQSDNIEFLKSAYESFANNQKELQSNLDNIQQQANAMENAESQRRATQEQATDNDIRTAIGEGIKGGATGEQIAKAQEALANHDYTGAVTALGDSLANASGIIGEYNFYKRDAQARGLTPISFDDYQNKDANRKARVAAAGAAISAGTNMTSKQQTVFNSIIDKQNKSPLIMANDRAVILKNMTDAVSKDPSNAALQVSFIYSMIQALDTYQSAVREGEIGLISGTQGLKDKISNMPSKIEQGNPLNPNVVKQYVAVANTLTNSINAAANSKKNVYRAQAISNGIGDQYNEWDTTVQQLNSQPGVGQENIQQQADKKESLKTFSKQSTANDQVVLKLRQAFPTATPEQIYDKLKEKGII